MSTGFTVRVDESDDKIFELNNFNAITFEGSPILSINSSNLSAIKNVFSHFEKIEIFNNSQKIAEYTIFNGYNNIVYTGDMFNSILNQFTDNLEVSLTKINLIQQVEQLNAKINPVIDINAMTLQELKEYKLSVVDEACKQDVYRGLNIATSSGTHNYSYEPEDQRNLDSFVLTLLLCYQLNIRDITYLPYHYDNGACELMPVSDIFTIFSNMKTALVSKITYGNLLKMMIRQSEDIDWLKQVQYGDNLIQEYQLILDNINNSIAEAMTKIYMALNPEQPEPENSENNE